MERVLQVTASLGKAAASRHPALRRAHVLWHAAFPVNASLHGPRPTRAIWTTIATTWRAWSVKCSPSCSAIIRSISPAAAPRSTRLAASFAQGLQMTNILKDVWEDRSRGACWLPQEVFTRHGVDLSAVGEPIAGCGFQRRHIRTGRRGARTPAQCAGLHIIDSGQGARHSALLPVGDRPCGPDLAQDCSQSGLHGGCAGQNTAQRGRHDPAVDESCRRAMIGC